MSDERNVLGLGALTAALRALPEDMRQRTLAAGVKEAIMPIQVAAKRFAKRSEETGALRESITNKVVNYPQNVKCVGLVGPDWAYYSRGKKVKGALSRLLSINQRRPASYAHLIEYGHVSVAPKKGSSRRKGTATTTGFVPAKPFIRPAVATTLGQQAEGFFRGVGKSFAAAARKLAA